MNRRFFVFRFFIEVKIPRRIVCRLMIPDQISTRFSHDSGSGAVHHQMQLLFRVSTIQLAQKREELLTAMLRYPGNSSVVGCVWTGGGGFWVGGGGVGGGVFWVGGGGVWGSLIAFLPVSRNIAGGLLFRV